jgi:hypothetical protein
VVARWFVARRAIGELEAPRSGIEIGGLEAPRSAEAEDLGGGLAGGLPAGGGERVIGGEFGQA